MANDPLGRVFPGDRPPNSARFFDRVVDAARRAQRTQTGEAPPPDSLDYPIDPANTVLVRAVDRAIDKFTVSRYGTAVITPAELSGRGEVNRRPMFDFAVPTGPAEQVCVTVGSAVIGGTTPAACAGAVVCLLSVSDMTHTRAVPIAGDSSKMESSDEGGYPILYKAGLGIGWGLILLGALADTELYAESGSGANDDDGSLGYFCLGPLQTVVGCDAEGGLVVTTTTFCVSAVIVGGRIRFTVTEAADPGDCNPASGTTNDCVHTDGPAPLVFAMTVGTFDNPTFADLEGGWSLTYAGSCSWTAGSPGGMGTGWGLTVTADGIVLAGTTGGNTVRYVLLGAAMDCGSLTLPRDLEDGSGVTQPATLTLTPA